MANLEEQPVNIFDSLKEENDSILKVPEINIPDRYSPEWSDYILSLFCEDELREGNPTCDGMRRILQKLFGPIIDEKLCGKNCQPNYAFVEFSITFFDRFDGQTKTFADCADVYEGNCEPPYYKHAGGTASTRAEGRVLRKALGLRKVLSAEEMSGEIRELQNKQGNFDLEGEFVDGAQLNAINLVCKRLNLNVWSILNRGENKFTNVKIIPADFARETMKYVNSELNGKEIPKELLGYDPNWQSQVNF